ncbi:hypothetical protein AAFF_G00027010, partial [Aldrovandia affinis]
MEKVLLLGVMLCCFNDVSAVMHSWKAFNTASTGLSEFPEFVVVNMMDDEETGRFDSRTSHFQYRQKWMEVNLGQDYVKQQTDILKSNMRVFKANVKTAMERFNQSGGVHVLQRMCGCEWDDETGITDVFNHYGYDGEDFLVFDLKNTRWISPSPQGVSTAHIWNNNPVRLEYSKSYLTQECIESLKKYVSYRRSTPERT